jgi:hypothetical protein
MADRIDVSHDELAMALRLWIRASPPLIWREDQRYEALKLDKRHDPSKEPDPKGDLAMYIADRFIIANWTVSREVYVVVDKSTGANARPSKADTSPGHPRTPRGPSCADP